MYVVFDLDGTLVNGDTHRDFLLYVSKNTNTSARISLDYIYLFLFSVLHKLKFISNEKFKSKTLRHFLKGKEFSDLELLAKSFAESVEFNTIYHNIFIHIKEKSVATASIDLYTKYLFPNIQIFASTLKYDNHKRVLGLDFNCYGKKKAEFICGKTNKRINRFFTDHMSDKFLMEKSDFTFFVQKGKIKKIITNKNEISNF
jgi:hypothetical protein